MRIEIDDKSGFCFGVVRAITEAEKALAEGGTVYSLGDIVHNRIEVQRLERLGLQTVTHDEMPRLAGCHLFIRAHGEPPTTYARARELGIDLIDATVRQTVRLEDYDCVGFASGVYFGKFHTSVLHAARQYLPHGKPVFFVCTYGGGMGQSTRELKELAPVAEKYQAYQKAEADSAAAEAMLSDPELRELAQEELAAARQEMDRLRQELKLLLIPRKRA